MRRGRKTRFSIHKQGKVRILLLAKMKLLVLQGVINTIERSKPARVEPDNLRSAVGWQEIRSLAPCLLYNPLVPDIVLTTLNASYSHPAVGLRYLYANLGALQKQAKIMEFDLAHRPVDVAERLLAEEPRIVGLGVYVWNAAPSAELVNLLKRLAPEVVVVLGGPEVSYECDQQPIVASADYTLTGEADVLFRQTCEKLLAGHKMERHILPADLPDLPSLVPPYEFYTAEDLKHRHLYVESSRGCPFKCEFCLSSLDAGVRNVPMEAFLRSMQRLLERGGQRFKFLDRTFNLDEKRCGPILSFFLERCTPGMFLHFEMVPERLPDALFELLARFPPGVVQLEVGIQTFNPQVAERIHRRLNMEKTVQNLKRLREHTGVHIHADLIAGLPGESLAGFAEGFDRLAGLHPQEIQVGLLKRLRGTAIVRHDAEFGMVYNPHPPYELLCNRDLDFATVQRLRRFARYWDLVANSGNFPQTLPLILADGSAFRRFLACSDFLYERTGQTHGIALVRLAELLFAYLTGPRAWPASQVAEALWDDYRHTGHSDRPKFLREYLPDGAATASSFVPADLPQRQARHLRKTQ